MILVNTEFASKLPIAVYDPGPEVETWTTRRSQVTVLLLVDFALLICPSVIGLLLLGGVLK